MRLTERERIEILIMIGCGDRMRTQEQVCDFFNKYPNREPISQSAVSKIERKFRETGSVKDVPKSGRKQTSEDKKLDVLLTFQENPHTSSRQVGLDNNMDHTTVLKILKKEKWHPYKVHLVQELLEDDFDRRVEFCENIMEKCNRDPLFVKNIIFSDEATFNINGHVNRQTCRYWASENPHWMQEHHTQYPQKVNVWAGIVGNTIIGPYFFEESLTGPRYLQFLQEFLLPTLNRLFPNRNDLWFQQDGAPPHYAIAVRNYLNVCFRDRWIGRRGSIEWPPRSPDLTPLDFFLWGYTKSKVYVNRPESLEDLKERIRVEISQITPETIAKVQEEFVSRLSHCIIAEGQQFEHLL